jgi:hypothetical protein
MRSLLQKEISIEMRVSTARNEREPLDFSDEELLAQFRSISLDLEEAKRSARQGRLPQAQAHLIDHVRDRLRPRFFLHPANRDKLVDQVKTDQMTVRRLLKTAEEAQSRTFTMLGLRKHFPSAIDWFTDFDEKSWIYGADTDLRAVLKRPNEESAKDMGPVEATWLFNSLDHFVSMGRAYWISGQETLVSEFVVQAVDWAERNPPQFGINWIDTVCVATRLVNWLLALNLFLSSDQLHDEVAIRLLKTIVLHGAVLADILMDEEREQSATQLVAAASALCLLALSFPELKPSQRWYDLASAELPRRAWECMGRDGFHLSGSASSHRQLLEWMLLPELLHRLNAIPSPKGLREATENACETLTLITPPDRKACDIGASGGHSFLGRFVGATEHNQRILALGAIACQRDDFRPGVEMPPELWWWLGPQAESFYQGIDIALSGGPKSRAFPEAGVVVARDHWERQANWCLLRGTPKASLLETSPPPPASIPLHDDALHLSLCLSGESVLVEPGGPELTHLVQPAFARITAHTAPRVGREREPLCLDRVSSRSETNMHEVKLGGNARYLAAHRPVWLDPDRPWRLWREVLFLPEARHIAIRDTLEGEGEVDFDTNLVLAPHLDILMRGDMGCLIRGKQLQARLVPIFPGRFRYSLKRGQQKPVAGWCYGGQRAIPTYCLRYFARLQAPFSTYLWLVWDPNDTRVPRTSDLDRQYSEVRQRLNLESD